MPLIQSGFIEIPTGAGARTIGIDPASHTVYAFLPAKQGAAVYQER
jgi:hypothetical protein